MRPLPGCAADAKTLAGMLEKADDDRAAVPDATGPPDTDGVRVHLPGVEVWAHGSRVTGGRHGGSGLDLVLRGPGLDHSLPGGREGDYVLD